MKKRIFTLFLSLALIIAASPLSVFAEGGAAVTVTVTDDSAEPGGYAAVYIYGENFNDVASLEITVRYDSSAMTVYSSGTGALLNGAFADIGTSVAGEVKLSAAAVKGIDSTSGSSYSNRLMYVRFKINNDTAAGTYGIAVTVGEVYDSAASKVAVSGGRGSVTVKERTVSVSGLYVYSSASAVTVGQELTLDVRHDSGKSFSAADFSVEYDREIFEATSVELSDALKTEGALYSVNTNTQGLILISYAALMPVNGTSLFSVRLKALKESTGTSVIVSANNVYNGNSAEYLPDKATKTYSVKKAETAADYPDLRLETGMLKTGCETVSTLYLEKGAGVAAGDFTVTYDPAVIVCRGVTVDDKVAEKGEYVVTNRNYGDGKIKFSYVNPSGLSYEDIALINIVWEPVFSPEKHTEITLSGTGVVDNNYRDIKLDYKGISPHIYDLRVTEPTCTEGGFTDYSCGCGDSFTADITEKTGHTDLDCDIICDACGNVITEKADINGDLSINILDLICLKKCAVYGYSAAETANPDINGDGDVNSLDISILRRFLINAC